MGPKIMQVFLGHIYHKVNFHNFTLFIFRFNFLLLDGAQGHIGQLTCTCF